MYRLKGEDAIIGFPNAENSVIADRDIYMARTLRAAALGGTCLPGSSVAIIVAASTFTCT